MASAHPELWETPTLGRLKGICIFRFSKNKTKNPVILKSLLQCFENISVEMVIRVPWNSPPYRYKGSQWLLVFLHDFHFGADSGDTGETQNPLGFSFPAPHFMTDRRSGASPGVLHWGGVLCHCSKENLTSCWSPTPLYLFLTSSFSFICSFSLPSSTVMSISERKHCPGRSTG